MNRRKKLIQDILGKPIHVVIDRPMGYCHKGLTYPVNYGYIPGVITGDGEEQDVYILGVETPLTEFDGVVIGAALRRNDAEDKLIAAPESMCFSREQMAAAVNFQERYFDTLVITQPEELP